MRPTHHLTPLALIVSAIAHAAIPVGQNGLPATSPTVSVDHIDPVVLAPYYITLSDRGTDRVRLTWNDRTGLEDSYKILRRGVTGAYQVVKTYGPLTGQTTYLDTGLTQDAFYCYRIQVTNSISSDLSDERCVFTRATEARPTLRVQLELETGDVSNAGTDDAVRVQLNTAKFLLEREDSDTWLDYGQDDFRRGTTFVYELRAPGDLNDITQLTLEKTGTDGWCVKRLRLIANASDTQDGRVVFEHDFQTSTTPCHWIDGNDGHQPRVSFLHSELRAHPSWPAADEPWFCGDAVTCAVDQLPVTFETIERRVEGYAGHVFHDLEYYGLSPRWDGALPIGADEWVSITPVDYQTARIDLYIEIDVPGWFNPDVHFAADLVVGPVFHADGSAATGILVENPSVNISADLIAELLSSLPCYVPIGGAWLIAETGECTVFGILEGVIADVISSSVPTPEIPPDGDRCTLPVIRESDVIGDTVTCDDYDQDGMPNDWELEHGLDPNDSGDAGQDPDGDGRTNLQEYQDGTDPMCAWPRGHENFCRDCGPCGLAEGDCDNDDQCARGLVCSFDVGASYGLPATTDVCELAPRPEPGSRTTRTF